MNTLHIEIPGEPIGQGRPRFSTVCGHAVAYDAPKSRNYKAYVKLIATEAIKKQEWKVYELPICLRIYAFFSVPKSKSKKFKEAALKGILFPTKKPDCSNIVKGIEDALNGLAYKDDAYICDLQVKKYYSDVPRVEVEVDYISP